MHIPGHKINQVDFSFKISRSTCQGCHCLESVTAPRHPKTSQPEINTLSVKTLLSWWSLNWSGCKPLLFPSHPHHSFSTRRPNCPPPPRPPVALELHLLLKCSTTTQHLARSVCNQRFQSKNRCSPWRTYCPAAPITAYPSKHPPNNTTSEGRLQLTTTSPPSQYHYRPNQQLLKPFPLSISHFPVNATGSDTATAYPLQHVGSFQSDLTCSPALHLQHCFPK